MSQGNLNDHQIFAIKTDNSMRVAIPSNYANRLSELLEEFGSFEKVPSAITVRGVFVIKKDNTYKPLNDTFQENDITVSQLVQLK